MKRENVKRAKEIVDAIEKYEKRINPTKITEPDKLVHSLYLRFGDCDHYNINNLPNVFDDKFKALLTSVITEMCLAHLKQRKLELEKELEKLN